MIIITHQLLLLLLSPSSLSSFLSFLFLLFLMISALKRKIKMELYNKRHYYYVHIYYIFFCHIMFSIHLQIESTDCDYLFDSACRFWHSSCLFIFALMTHLIAYYRWGPVWEIFDVKSLFYSEIGARTLLDHFLVIYCQLVWIPVTKWSKILKKKVLCSVTHKEKKVLD